MKACVWYVGKKEHLMVRSKSQINRMMFSKDVNNSLLYTKPSLASKLDTDRRVYYERVS